MQVDLASDAATDHFGHLFAEELGLLLEVDPADEQQVLQAYTDAGLPAHAIGSVTADAHISISTGGAQQISGGATAAECLNTCYCQCRLKTCRTCSIVVIELAGCSACCQHACCS